MTSHRANIRTASAGGAVRWEANTPALGAPLAVHRRVDLVGASKAAAWHVDGRHADDRLLLGGGQVVVLVDCDSAYIWRPAHDRAVILFDRALEDIGRALVNCEAVTGIAAELVRTKNSRRRCPSAAPLSGSPLRRGRDPRRRPEKVSLDGATVIHLN
jgi:hypothetical protein